MFGNYGAVTRDVVTEFDHGGCEMNGNNEQFDFPNEKKNHNDCLQSPGKHRGVFPGCDGR